MLPIVAMIYLTAPQLAMIFSRDEQVVELASRFMRASIPAILINSQIDLQRRWLLRMRIADIPMISNILMLFIHIPIACVFVYSFGMDFIGLAYALGLSLAVNYIFTLIQMQSWPEKQEAFFLPDSLNSDEWHLYFNKAVPRMLLFVTFFLTQEVFLVLAGILGSNELATQTIAIITVAILHVLSMGA
jgi:Na+-driven multidrug efflux pump